MVSNGDTFYMKVVELVNCYAPSHALVNCYALGPTGQHSVLVFYTDHARNNSAQISSFLKFLIFRKFVFVSVASLTTFAFVFIFKC